MTSSRTWIVPLAAAVALAALPAVLTPYTQDLVKIAVYAIFALSLELLVGMTGLVSLGHAAFLGIGAYVAVLASGDGGAAPLQWLLPVSVAAAAAYALFVGMLCLRTRGVYFIMVTLAFAQMAYFVFHDTKVGGGSDGIFLYAKPVLALAGKPGSTSTTSATSTTRCSLAGVHLRAARVDRPLALRPRADRHSRQRAAHARGGFHTYGYKLAAFVIAGALAGLAGFLLAVKDGAVNPELLSWHESGAVLLMIILGGIGSLRGAVIGAVAFTLLKEFCQSEALLGPAGRTLAADARLHDHRLRGLAAEGPDRPGGGRRQMGAGHDHG